MEDFSNLCLAQLGNMYVTRRNTAIKNLITSPSDVVERLNIIFGEAINEQLTRSDIVKRIDDLISTVEGIESQIRENITAEMVYEFAIQIFAGKTIRKDEKEFFIGKRRGPNGGFRLTEKIDEPLEEKNTSEEIKKIEEEIEKTNTAIDKAEESGRMLEKHYYPLVLKWAQENGFERCEITGGLIPGPKWENPDLIEMYFDFGKNTAQLNIEVTSFEVKLRIDPQAIWQAAHYSRFSHYAFIAFALTEEEVRAADRVFDLAIKFGLGILTLDQSGGKNEDEKKFKLIHSPTRNNPSPDELEVIVSRFLDSDRSDQRFINTKKQLIEAKIKLAQNLLFGFPVRFTFEEK